MTLYDFFYHLNLYKNDEIRFFNTADSDHFVFKCFHIPVWANSLTDFSVSLISPDEYPYTGVEIHADLSAYI